MTATDPLLRNLSAAIRHWHESDPTLADLAQAHPPEPWPDHNDDPFVALARAIVHQQVSMAAARTIYGRFEQAVGRVAPQEVMQAGEPALRAAGLSTQKTTYLLDLAARCASGELDLAGLQEMEDTLAVLALTQVRGIGVWSAKMFLIFHLHRPDVCPHEDLGVRLAVEKFYGVPEKEAAKWLQEREAAWSPWNSLAARVLWHARRADDGPPHAAGAPDAPA